MAPVTVNNHLAHLPGCSPGPSRTHRPSCCPHSDPTKGHQGGQTRPATYRHARPLRDRAIVHVLFSAGLCRAELVGVDLV